MPRADPGDTDAPDREIRLVKSPDGRWTARDLSVGVVAQGKNRGVALDNLDAVVEAVEGNGGRPPTDDEIRDLGVEPEVARSQGEGVPDILQ